MRRDPSIINVDAKVLLTANLFADKTLHQKEVYGAVRIEPASPIKGAYVIALDGSCMCVQYDPSAVCKKATNVCVSETMSTQLKPGRRFIRTHDDKIVIRDPNETADRAYSTMDTLAFNMRDFPKWRSILPEDWSAMERGYPACLNAGYMQKIAALHLEDVTMAPVHFFTGPKMRHSEGSTAVVMFARNTNMFVVLAPIGSEMADLAEPIWLNPEDPAADL